MVSNNLCFAIVLLTLCNIQLFGQKNNNMNDQNYSFEKEWKEVDQLESKGLPKSSLEVIDSIYKTAKASNNEVWTSYA